MSYNTMYIHFRVAGLLSKVIERLETDYDSSEYEGKMVEEVKPLKPSPSFTTTLYLYVPGPR